MSYIQSWGRDAGAWAQHTAHSGAHTPWPSSEPNVRACLRTITGCPGEPAKSERGFFMGKGFRGNGATRALAFRWFPQNPVLHPLHFHMQVIVTHRSAVDDRMSLK